MIYYLILSIILSLFLKHSKIWHQNPMAFVNIILIILMNFVLVRLSLFLNCRVETHLITFSLYSTSILINCEVGSKCDQLSHILRLVVSDRLIKLLKTILMIVSLCFLI